MHCSPSLHFVDFESGKDVLDVLSCVDEKIIVDGLSSEIIFGIISKVLFGSSLFFWVIKIS